jgi:predicted nucleic acid-binding protein
VPYEWFRGPRNPDELAAQEGMFPTSQALSFGVDEAGVASGVYKQLSRPRGRELDVSIAAHALVRGAMLWTLNEKDFADIPDLRLAR